MYPGSRYLRQLAARASGGSADLKSADSKSSVTGGSSTMGVLSGAGGGPLQPIAPLPHGVSSASGAETVQIMTVSGGGAGVAGGATIAYGIPASEDVGGGVYLDPAILEDTGTSAVAFHGDADTGTTAVYRLPVRASDHMDMPKVCSRLTSLPTSTHLLHCSTPYIPSSSFVI